MKSGTKKFNSMFSRNVEEIQSHLEEIVHLKEKEIKLTKMKQLEFEQKEADLKKHHPYRLRLSKQIRYYAKSGKLKILKAVLKKATVSSDLKLVDWKSQKGCTALHWAASRGHEHIIKELIESGANPTIMTQYGQLPADLTRYKPLRVKLQIEAQKWKTKSDVLDEHFEPIGENDKATKIESKRVNVKTMQKAIYSEMSDYIHSLKKLKNSKINELIDQYSNMDGGMDCSPNNNPNPSQCEI